MANENATAQPGTPGERATLERGRENSEMDLLGLFIVLAKHKNLVLGLPLVASVVAAVISLLMPNIYTGTARILPPQQNQSTAAAILGQLGLGSGALGGLTGLKNPSDLYVGMLKSRTVADRLIERYQLKERLDEDTLVETRKALEGVTNISAGRDGIITVDVYDKDANLAAAMANAYIEELEKMNEALALTEASQRRLFFERQLKQTKNDLASSEIELKKTQEKTGLIKLDDQGRAIIEAAAQLKAQVAAKEVQIRAMKSFATARNPELVRAQQELSGLHDQLRRMERDNLAGDGNIFVPTGRVPEAGLEYIRRFRDVKYQETLFELVAKQYELARLDEAKEASLIQMIDKAVPADRKSKPKRSLIVILTGLIVGIIAVLVAFLREAQEGARQNPEQAARLDLLKRYLRRRIA